MNILHIAPLTFNQSSGLVNAIPRIVEEQNKIENVTSCLLNVFQVENPNGFNFDYYSHEAAFEFEKNFLTKSHNKIQLVVFHSFFIFKYIRISKILRKNNIPYIIIPHGALMNSAVNSKKTKKTIANWLFFKKFIQNSQAIQFLSLGEQKKSIKFGKVSHVIPNGLDTPIDSNNKNFVQNKEINFTFLGRLDIKTKGIDKLLEVIRLIQETKKKNLKIHFNIYGPDNNGSVNFIGNYINKFNLTDIVTLGGPVYGVEKEKAYLNTDIYIQLSRNEGLPTTILEALSYGIPSIVSVGTNLGEVVNKKSGWQAESDSSELANQIHSIIERTTFDQFQEYKKNARNIIEKNYSWRSVSEKSISFYDEIINN